LKHRDLRKTGHFSRPWLIEAKDGNFIDLIDSKPFTTEFSHTRFLVPKLTEFKGWALFMDSDMLALSDIAKLFALAEDKYAVMCVKHQHKPAPGTKMDDRPQLAYYRKNWSSFVLWNCCHPANRFLTEDRVNIMSGSDLHSFSWLDDTLIGALPHSYNYISGVSPKLPPERGHRPDIVHYTEGGPWFPKCKNVPYAQMWVDEYEDWQLHGQHISDVPSTSFEKQEVIRK
jgi:lipopolysaccharide biosynthesis glycosyltransferase